MKVILNEDLENIGFKDDVLEVKSGYARNYLIPRGIAKIANVVNMKVHAENMKQHTFKIEQMKNDAKEMAQRMNDTILRVPAKAGDSGKIFGAVTSAQLAEVLNAQGFEVNRKRITIKGEVKSLGTYLATIVLHKEVTCEVNFEVIKG